MGYGRLNAYRAVSQAITTNGPDNLCSSSDYKLGDLENLPSDWSVSWSVSPSNIVSVSQTDDYINLTPIGKGKVTITANLQTQYSSDARTITKEIWIGAPNVPIIMEPSFLSYKETGYYFFDTSIDQPSTIDYLWDADGLQIIGVNNNPKAKFQMAAGPTHIIYLKLFNGCQENGLDYVEGNFAVLFDDFTLTVFPNPAKDNVSISVLDNDGIVESTSTTNEIRIYDSQTNLKKIFTTKNNNINLNVSDLQIGIYIINVTHNGKTRAGQLVISR